MAIPIGVKLRGGHAKAVLLFVSSPLSRSCFPQKIKSPKLAKCETFLFSTI
ncbi:hypothetical protein H6501_04010 [Candidatus Woesearchaeota archaeon]|nr:hypothetical protein [Candidatus Woesearchaeota archaeon]